MTPRMLRTVGWIAAAVALIIGLGAVLDLALVDDPVPGVVGFGLVALACFLLAKRGKRAERE